MVGKDLMARLAMRYDTVMSWAMRRALGIEARPRPAPRPRPAALVRERARTDGGGVDPDVLWCFRNHHPVMDGPRRG